jgi:hypothetical protein
MTVEQRIAAMESEAERLRLMGGGAAVAPRWAAAGRARAPLTEEEVCVSKLTVEDK